MDFTTWFGVNTTKFYQSMVWSKPNEEFPKEWKTYEEDLKNNKWKDQLNLMSKGQNLKLVYAESKNCE